MLSGSTLKRAPKREYYLENKTELNHCIIIRYSGPQHFAPPHHDKQEGTQGVGAKDILPDTDIVSVTITSPGEERLFTIQEPTDGTLVWQKRLGDGDVFMLGPQTNKRYKHAVPSEGQHGSVRYSIIYRSVRTMDLAVLEKDAEKRKVNKANKKRAREEEGVEEQ